MNNNLYKRPDKPRTVNYQTRSNEAVPPSFDKLPEPIAVNKETECHVTPLDIARRMVSYANIDLSFDLDFNVLEPHAGTGQIVQAYLDAGLMKNEIVTVEKNYDLCDSIYKRFNSEIIPEHNCFLEFSENYQGQPFHAIVCNPPFKKIKKHINAAVNLLAPGCSLVSIVPSTFNHHDHVVLEHLSADTFASTKVNTKIIRITKDY